MDVTALRRGMWVMTDDGVGIANEIDGDQVEVHLVDTDDGTTTEIRMMAAAEVDQASHDEIPDCRRPDEATLIRLGYMEGEATEREPAEPEFRSESSFEPGDGTATQDTTRG